MIIMNALRLVFAILIILFNWMDLPDMPLEITSVLDQVKTYVIDGLPIVWCFFDKKITTICLSISLAAYNFEKVYYFLMWIIAKLPFSIDKN